MIFAEADHLEQIIAGTKVQTRRVAKPNSFIYRVGRTYGIRSCRICRNIPEGRILILRSWLELRQDKVTRGDADCEGGYTPEEYEELFEKMHPNWVSRYAYAFKFVSNSDLLESGDTE